MLVASNLIKANKIEITKSEYLLKGAGTDMRYFAKSKFSRSIVHKKNFSLI